MQDSPNDSRVRATTFECRASRLSGGCMDLTGGLAPNADSVNLDPSWDLAAGENHAFWVFDKQGEYGLLNCHVQAGGVPGQSWPDWQTRRVSFAIAAPDGRLFVDWVVQPGSTSDTLTTGGWTFRCAEPFVRWTASYRGTPVAMTNTELRSGVRDLAAGERVPVEVDLELTMALPPWIQGDFAEDLPEREKGLTFIGIPRYEQLYRATGEIRHDGRSHRVNATGLRTHRYGPRSITLMGGHSWLTTVFPSGRGFGVMRFPSADGGDMFREAWVSDPSGKLVAARLIDSPWLTKLDCVGETWKVVLDTPDGRTEIDGETLACSYSMANGANHAPGSFVLAHGMGRFRWNGEEACGLIERSAPIEALS
jgi:hypothetical protein